MSLPSEPHDTTKTLEEKEGREAGNAILVLQGTEIKDAGLDIKARHACHCGKSFIRKEHLTRHQATHYTLAYICEICQRQFSRRDLVRRHSALHEASHRRVVVSCDACRANKTKCSGGSRCSLCTRRGIDCTFRSGLRQPRREYAGNSSTAVNATVGEHDANLHDKSASPTNPRPENFPPEQPLHTKGEPLAPNIEFLKNITVVSSQPGTTVQFQSVSRGMEGIYELLVAEKPSLEGAMQESDELQECVTEYLETYLKNFHLRWPILHAPTLDMEMSAMPLTLAASVCVIGAWLQGSANWNERFYALRVHEILLQRLLRSLIEPELIPEGQAWPIELFQGIILTLVFSLYRTDKTALSRAMLLRSTFITLLRELGAFDAETLESHLKTHFSGTFAPYTLCMREKFTHLLAMTYQFDAYFSLAHEKPPILHRQEVCVGLTSTFALWNAHGIDVFATRQPEEPPGRFRFQISEMTNSSDSFKGSRLLVEDVQLGLCGLLQAVWVFRQSSSSSSASSKTRRPPSNVFQKLLLIETLDDWKFELDKIIKLANARSITGNAARDLLLAYRGADDSVAASVERITTLAQDGMVLYYYMKMYHNAGLMNIEIEGTDTDDETVLQTSDKYGREALVCAMQILKMVELIGASKACLNPLVRHALAMGVNVTKKALTSSQRRECECLTNAGGQHTDLNLPQWAETVTTIGIDGTPVCVCTLKSWIKRFEKAIQDQSIMAE